jgi:hypothetical protein
MKWSTVPLVVFFTCIALVLDFTVASNAVNWHIETVTNILFNADNRAPSVWFQANYSMDQVATLADGFERYYRSQNVQSQNGSAPFHLVGDSPNITSLWSWMKTNGDQFPEWWITVSETYQHVTVNWVVFLLFVALNICMVITDIIVIVEVILKVDSHFYSE